jgi:N utilization substance protein B
MTRTVAREIAVQLSFWMDSRREELSDLVEAFFDRDYYSSLATESELFSDYPDSEQLGYIKAVVLGQAEHSDELDALIEKYSKGWKLSRISRIAVTVLKIALFEVLYMDEVPDSVAINEAVELSKGYEEPETVSFINGILGGFMRAEKGYDPSIGDKPLPEDEDQ